MVVNVKTGAFKLETFLLISDKEVSIFIIKFNNFYRILKLELLYLSNNIKIMLPRQLQRMVQQQLELEVNKKQCLDDNFINKV